MNHDHFIVPPGKKIRLKDFGAGFTGALVGANFLSDTAALVYDDAPDGIKRVIAESGYHCRGEVLSGKTTKEAQ